MTDQSLVDDLTTTLCDLDDLANQHQESVAYAATQERLAYLHDLLRQVYDDMTHFKQDALACQQDAYWHATCQELRTSEPPSLRAPARALVGAGTDVLDLVAYVSAARACIRERRAALAQHHTVADCLDTD